MSNVGYLRRTQMAGLVEEKISSTPLIKGTTSDYTSVTYTSRATYLRSFGKYAYMYSLVVISASSGGSGVAYLEPDITENLINITSKPIMDLHYANTPISFGGFNHMNAIITQQSAGVLGIYFQRMRTANTFSSLNLADTVGNPYNKTFAAGHGFIRQI